MSRREKIRLGRYSYEEEWPIPVKMMLSHWEDFWKGDELVVGREQRVVEQLMNKGQLCASKHQQDVCVYFFYNTDSMAKVVHENGIIANIKIENIIEI